MKLKFVSRLGLRRGDSKTSDVELAHPSGATEIPFKYEKNVCALSWWEPIRLLEEGSISDIHLVKRRDAFLKVRYKEKRDVMDLAKKESSNSTSKHDSDADVYVLKSIMKDHIGDDLVLHEMRTEIRTMSSLNHPNICRLVEAYERRRHIYLVMEFCSGGNLAGRVPMPEKAAAVVCRKILSAVAYMHAQGVAHRDIKLENIMLDSKGEIKLIDFGLATAYLNDDYKNMTDKVGTLYSMAPQVLNGSYDERCDLWSVGVVSYLLLSGDFPFWGPKKSMPWCERRKIMIDLIENCRYAPMNRGHWQSISQPAKDFVKSLLQLNPDDRPSAMQALETEWIQAVGGDQNGDAGDDIDVMGTDIRKGEELEQLSNLRRKVWRLLSSKLTEDEIQDLRAYMEVNDEDGGGLISVGELLSLLKDVADTTTNLTVESIEELLVDEDTVDISNRLNYVDLMVEVLIGRGRNTVKSFARALDDLDMEGTRMVRAEDLKPLIDAHIPSDLREELWNSLDVDGAGTVNTSTVLGLVTKKVARQQRESIRSRSGRSK